MKVTGHDDLVHVLKGNVRHSRRRPVLYRKALLLHRCRLIDNFTGRVHYNVHLRVNTSTSHVHQRQLNLKGRVGQAPFHGGRQSTRRELRAASRAQFNSARAFNSNTSFTVIAYRRDSSAVDFTGFSNARSRTLILVRQRSRASFTSAHFLG